MTVMSGRQNSAPLRYQRIRSLLCLFALLLLQLPAISAAVMAATGACCSTDNCPLALHHHPAPAQAAPAKAQESAMDCGHEMNPGTGKMSSCSMSCCKTVEQSAIHGHFFVLSPNLLDFSRCSLPLLNLSNPQSARFPQFQSLLPARSS